MDRVMPQMGVEKDGGDDGAGPRRVAPEVSRRRGQSLARCCPFAGNLETRPEIEPRSSWGAGSGGGLLWQKPGGSWAVVPITALAGRAPRIPRPPTPPCVPPSSHPSSSA